MRLVRLGLLVVLAVSYGGTASVIEAAERGWRGHITFAANRHGSWDIFLLDLLGREAVRLTTSPLDERAPCISPDGTSVAYATSGGRIEILRIETGEIEPVALPEGRYGNPAWTPDGRALLVTSYRFLEEGEDADLWRYDLESAAARPLLVQPGIQDQASVSLDGTALIYSSGSTVAIRGLGTTVVQQIWLASLRDGGVHPLVLGQGEDIHPVWSPDGSTVMFYGIRDGRAGLWLHRLNGDELASLVEVDPRRGRAAWSPDGAGVAYIAETDAGDVIEIVDLESGESERIDVFPGTRVRMMELDWR